jgi:hypothetical protein
MAHGISPYHASFSAVETHARGRTMDGEAMQKKVIAEVNRSTPEEQNALGFLRILKPEQHVALEKIYNRDTNKSMRAHLRTMQENSFPESRDERIEEARVKAEEAKKAYNDENGRHTNNGTSIPPSFSAAEANLRNLRQSNSLEETSRTRLENECNKNWATNVSSEDSSKLRALYESYLDRSAEHRRLEFMSPKDFIEKESIYTYHELKSSFRQSMKNTSDTEKSFLKALNNAEKGAYDKYVSDAFLEFKKSPSNLIQSTPTLRKELLQAFDGSDNLTALHGLFAAEDQAMSASQKLETFIESSEAVSRFHTDAKNTHQQIYEIGRTKGSEEKEQELNGEIQRLETSKQKADEDLTAKTKEAKSQKTQKRWAWGVGGTAFAASLAAIAFILNKPPQTANYPQ